MTTLVEQYFATADPEQTSRILNRFWVSRRARFPGVFKTAAPKPQIALCDPSQSAPFLLCLQPQKYTVELDLASYFTGVNSLPLCEPSQNGCDLLRPHAHQ
jgi:hypothetical protein